MAAVTELSIADWNVVCVITVYYLGDQLVCWVSVLLGACLLHLILCVR